MKDKIQKFPFFVPIYRSLHQALGDSHWWPGDTPFEVIVGAILTQNTSWKNVEKGIGNLKERGLLDPRKMAALPGEELAVLIRSTGYYNQKAKKLKAFLQWFDSVGFSVHRIQNQYRNRPEELRKNLLSIHGIGPETADSILCYAFQFPYFVVDKYTLRWLARFKTSMDGLDYHGLQDLVHREFSEFFLPQERTGHFNEFHALMVRLGNGFCKKTKPLCSSCPLSELCDSAHGIV